jgi:hypothetical protein
MLQCYIKAGNADTIVTNSALLSAALSRQEWSCRGLALHALSQYGNAVLDRGEINEGERHEEARVVSIS